MPDARKDYGPTGCVNCGPRAGLFAVAVWALFALCKPRKRDRRA